MARASPLGHGRTHRGRSLRCAWAEPVAELVFAHVALGSLVESRARIDINLRGVDFGLVDVGRRTVRSAECNAPNV